MRTCPHLSREFVQRTPCRPCVHCRGWIDARGRVMNDATALRRYPQHAAEIHAQPMRGDAPAGGLGGQLLAVLGALGAVTWRLLLLVLAAPVLILAYLILWQIVAH